MLFVHLKMLFNFDSMIYTPLYLGKMDKRPSQTVDFFQYFYREMSAGFCSFSESCLCANNLAQVQKKIFSLLSPPLSHFLHFYKILHL